MAEAGRTLILTQVNGLETGNVQMLLPQHRALARKALWGPPQEQCWCLHLHWGSEKSLSSSLRVVRSLPKELNLTIKTMAISNPPGQPPSQPLTDWYWMVSSPLKPTEPVVSYQQTAKPQQKDIGKEAPNKHNNYILRLLSAGQHSAFLLSANEW